MIYSNLHVLPDLEPELDVEKMAGYLAIWISVKSLKLLPFSEHLFGTANVKVVMMWSFTDTLHTILY